MNTDQENIMWEKGMIRAFEHIQQICKSCVFTHKQVLRFYRGDSARISKQVKTVFDIDRIKRKN